MGRLGSDLEEGAEVGRDLFDASCGEETSQEVPVGLQVHAEIRSPLHRLDGAALVMAFAQAAREG